MNIQPRFLTFVELVAKRLFRIPEYQRAYSWKSKHRKDLFDDMLKVHKTKAQSHFMAMVVGLMRHTSRINTDEFARLDVVDGQQRLTTLILLFKAIEKALDEKDKSQAALRAEIRNLLVKDEAGTLLLLQTNHDRSAYFANYLRSGVVPDHEQATFLADRDLALAILECERFVDAWSERYGLLDLATLIKNRLTFIFHEIDDEAAVYTVFEVLNSRGLDVAWLDRAKTTLMAIAFEGSTTKGHRKEVIDELHTTWGEVYATIGLHEGMSSETLRFAATLASTESMSKVLGEEASVDVIRSRCDGKVGKTLEMSQWIHCVAIRVDQLLGDRRRAAITKIAHARLLAVAILLADFNDKQKEQLLDQWERVTFRIFGMARNDARTEVGNYVRLAQQIRALLGTPEDFRNALAALRELGVDKYKSAKAVEYLRGADCYEGWDEELRYFLFRYEEHLAKRAGQKFSNEQWERIWRASPSQTIEHVHPQKPASGGPWQGALGRGRGQKEANINRLGNLALLPPGLNSKLGNLGFTDKKPEYRNCGLLHLQEIWKKQAWTKKAIEERERRLVEWAKAAWADL